MNPTNVQIENKARGKSCNFVKNVTLRRRSCVLANRLCRHATIPHSITLNNKTYQKDFKKSLGTPYAMTCLAHSNLQSHYNALHIS